MAFQILSLSGGGYLGLYTISVIADLEREIGRPISSCFDLVAGTSIGGILALGLAAEVPAKDIKKAFEKDGEKIFSSRPAPTSKLGRWRDIGRSATSSKYDGKQLRASIEGIVGVEKKIGDLKHRVVVPAVNLTKGAPQVFKTPHHDSFKFDLHLKVADVAMATSAAPTYFPLAEIGDSLFADGGLYANSPDAIAVHEAEHFLDVQCEDINVLSVGTTTSNFSFAHAEGTDLGIAGWASNQRLMKVMIASQQASVNFMMQHRLGSRYHRIDANQSPEQERDLALDVANEPAQKTIRSLARASVQEHINNSTLTSFLNNVAPKPTFFDCS